MSNDETPEAQQQRLENQMWTERLRRQQQGRRPSWRPPTGPSRQEREAAARRQEAIEKKQEKDREFNTVLYMCAFGFMLFSVISLAGGLWLLSIDPATMPNVDKTHASTLRTVGLIGCIFIIPAFMLARRFRRR